MKNIDPNLLFFGNAVDASVRLDDVKDFLRHVDSYFNRERERLEKEGHPDREIELAPLFAEDLPPILYTSAIITLVSLLDLELRGMCSEIQEPLKLSLSFAHLSGSVLERFRRYAISLADLDIRLTETDWQDIQAVYELRNCLVHSDGNLTKFSKRKIIEAFDKRYNLAIVGEDTLNLDLVATERIASIVSSFLDEVFEGAISRFPGEYGRRQSNTT